MYNTTTGTNEFRYPTSDYCEGWTIDGNDAAPAPAYGAGHLAASPYQVDNHPHAVRRFGKDTVYDEPTAQAERRHCVREPASTGVKPQVPAPMQFPDSTSRSWPTVTLPQNVRTFEDTDETRADEHKTVNLGGGGCSYACKLDEPFVLPNGDTMHAFRCGVAVVPGTHYCRRHGFMNRGRAK